MKLLANPVFVRMAVALLSCVAAFVGGIVAIRMLRRGMVEDGASPAGPDLESALPMHAATVIQQLKQQKFALQSEQKTERRRAKTSEQITTAMIANLPCGILFVTPNGLVRQANAAARRILGFASPLGMSVGELFRNAQVTSDSEAGTEPSRVFENALRGGAAPAPGQIASEYVAPNQEKRLLEITLMPATGTNSEMLGLALAISDQSEIAELRRSEILRAETSAEMALELHTSLASIREWAGQIGTHVDPQRLTRDMAAEVEHLQKSVGGFLAGREKARTAQA